MSDPLPSVSQSPDHSASPSLLPSRLDDQRLAQACLEAIHLLRHLDGLHLDQVPRLLVDRALLRLTFVCLHSDSRSDLLDVLGIHRACLERLRIQPFRPTRSD